MASLGDLIRDTSLAKAMFGMRYGEQDPYTLAIQKAESLGYPQPGSSSDEGEAQRYMSAKLAAERMGPIPLITNPLHEAVLSWVSEGEGHPSMKRLMAGYRGALDALEAPKPTPEPVREGYGLQGAQILPAQPSGISIGDILAAAFAGRR